MKSVVLLHVMYKVLLMLSALVITFCQHRLMLLLLLQIQQSLLFFNVDDMKAAATVIFVKVSK